MVASQLWKPPKTVTRNKAQNNPTKSLSCEAPNLEGKGPQFSPVDSQSQAASAVYMWEMLKADLLFVRHSPSTRLSAQAFMYRAYTATGG